jgi:hypothetical protein
MAVVIRKPFTGMLKTRTNRLHAMGVVKTNEPGVVGRMQCQAVPDALGSLIGHIHAQNFHLHPVARLILNFNIAIQTQ